MNQVALACQLAAALTVPTGGAQAAPVLTGGAPTLVGSWDFGDASKLTLASGSAGGGGAITAIAGSDGVSVTLTGGSNGGAPPGPTSVMLNGQLCARFTVTTGPATSQYMTAASGLGLVGTGITMIAICEPVSGSTGTAVFEVCNSAGSSTQNRHAIGFSSTQFTQTKEQNGGNVLSSTPTYGSPISKIGQRIIIGRGDVGTAPPVLNVDAGANVTGTAALNATALNTVSLCSSVTLGSRNSYTDAYVTRILVYAGYLTDAQVAQVVTWATIRYGIVGGAAGAVIAQAPVLAQVAAGSPVTWTTGQTLGAPTPTVTYNLYVNGALAVAGATSGAYSAANTGDVIVLEQYAANTYGAHRNYSIPMTVGGASAAATVVGVPVVGVPLSYTLSAGTAASQQWYRNTLRGQQPVQGATGPTYTPTSADVGAYFSVRGVKTDGVAFQSSEFGTIAPTNTLGVVPTIAPTADTAPATTTRPAYNTGVGCFVKSGALYDYNGNKFRVRGVNADHYDSAVNSGVWNTGANVVRYAFYMPSSWSIQKGILDKAVATKCLVMVAPQNGSATFNATLSGTTMTASGTVGIISKSANVTINGTSYGTISSFGTGTGGDGTYTVTVSGTVATAVPSYTALKGSTLKDPTIPLSNVAMWVSQAANWLQYDKYMMLNVVNEWGASYTVGAVTGSITSNTLTTTAGSPYIGQWLEGSGMTKRQVTAGSGTSWTVTSGTDVASMAMNDVTWRETYITAITQLRTAGYTCPIVLDAPNAGQDTGSTCVTFTNCAAAVLAADPLGNVAFSTHMYGLFPIGSAAATMTTLMGLQNSLGAPFIIGEFGPGKNVGPSPTLLDPIEVVGAAEARNIGWLVWAWDDHLNGSVPEGDSWFGLVKDWYSGFTTTQAPSELTIFGNRMLYDPAYGLKLYGTPASVFS